MSQHNALDSLLSAAYQHFDEYHGKVFRDFVRRCCGGPGFSPYSLSDEQLWPIILRYASLISTDGRLARSVSVTLENSLGKEDSDPFVYTVSSDLRGLNLGLQSKLC